MELERIVKDRLIEDYERYVMNKNDIENIISEHYEDGLAVGREEGLVLAAKNMKIQGFPLDVIMTVTGSQERPARGCKYRC